jgi:hypothetical protein
MRLSLHCEWKTLVLEFPRTVPPLRATLSDLEFRPLLVSSFERNRPDNGIRTLSAEPLPKKEILGQTLIELLSDAPEDPARVFVLGN